MADSAADLGDGSAWIVPGLPAMSPDDSSLVNQCGATPESAATHFQSFTASLCWAVDVAVAGMRGLFESSGRADLGLGTFAFDAAPRRCARACALACAREAPMTNGGPQAASGASARAMASAAHLAVFAALIDLENDANAFDALFRALAAVLGFDRALVLADTDGAAYCVAAQPADLAGRRWPGRALRDAMTVRAFAPGSGAGAQDGLLAALADGRPALALPIGLGGRPALLVLLRAPAAVGFDENDLALARHYAAFALSTVIADRK